MNGFTKIGCPKVAYQSGAPIFQRLFHTSDQAKSIDIKGILSGTQRAPSRPQRNVAASGTVPSYNSRRTNAERNQQQNPPRQQTSRQPNSRYQNSYGKQSSNGQENNRSSYGEKRMGNNGQIRIPRFNLPQASFKAIDCIKHLIKKVYIDFENPRGVINFMDGDSGDITTTNMRDLINSREWDLNEVGFAIVSVSASGKRKIPLIKCVDKRTAIQKYSDELADVKAQELAGMSTKFASIAEMKKSQKSTASSVKYVKIGWSISESDLTTKKKTEIMNAMNKANTVMIIFDSKDSLDRLNVNNVDINDLQKKKGGSATSAIHELELLRREKALGALADMLDGDDIVSHKSSTTGSVKDRMIFTLKVNKQAEATPKPSEKNTKSDKEDLSLKNLDNVKDVLKLDLTTITDKKLLKEIRKRQRQEKQKLRESKKRGELN
ncbi:Aim23 protein [Saccharomycopsis crataegensis]|uniref:Altered inheritance of mitochondria protein 23, mitochondrial n=1 Tax=Saccharomycopsis crataegensis TaxID=43959 RepID=A0AAV5QWG7_9ASCO|nr:Aim23 protein [Saccharomycopsis crataegensis]